ncbi:MAG: hypothetical protein AAGD07_16760 [Planctomycetota bacterium]
MNPPDPTNPFVVALDNGPSPRARFRRSLLSFVAVALLTSILLMLWFQGRRLVVAYLASDLAGQSDAIAQQRLMQLAQMTPEAITPVADSLWHPSDPVAQAAFNVVQQWQQAWPTLPEKTRARHAEALINAIAAAVPKEMSDGTATERHVARCEELLRTALIDHTSDDPQHQVSRASQRIASVAQATLSRVASLHPTGSPKSTARVPGSGRPERSTLPMLETNTTGQGRPATVNRDQQRVAAPIAAIVARESVRIEPPLAAWTDWPPPSEATRPAVVTSEYQIAAGASPPIVAGDSPGIDASTNVVNLKPVPNGRMPHLLPAPEQISAPGRPLVAFAGNAPGVAELGQGTAGLIKTASHVESNLMHALVDQSVIAHLAAKDPTTAQMAALELKQRGWSDELVDLGRRYAMSSTDGRIAMVRNLTQSDRYDSQPWLLMLLTDPDRLARLYAVSVLSQSKDRYVRLRLRERLDQETDAHVATRLRRALGLR